MSMEKYARGEKSVGELSEVACASGNDQGFMIRGGNSLGRPIIIYLEINDLM